MAASGSGGYLTRHPGIQMPLTEPSPTARLTVADLLALQAGYASTNRWIGGEYERTVVRGDGRSIGYFEPDGIRYVLAELEQKLGWKPYVEHSEHGDNVIALEAGKAGGGASITLEPGGQVELSGKPFATLRELDAEIRQNRAMLLELSQGKDHHWLSCGLTPYAPIDSIAFVPKGRYAIMREYLPKVGPLAHWMMKGTTSVQANFDYASETDCARKFKVSLGLGPLNTAMFANSPIAEGRATGWRSYRAHVWTQTDPARTGFPLAVRERYTHARWVDYLLDAPMMFVKDHGTWLAAEGLSFRAWMDNGFAGRFPTLADWELHQTSVFPEVRVKRTIEIRGADCVPIDLAVAFGAFWFGVLYGALDDASDWLDQHMVGDPMEAQIEGGRFGLSGQVWGRSTAALAREIVDIADAGLRRLGEDRELLTPLKDQVASGHSPADRLIRAWEEDRSPASFLRACAY